jgi:peptidoglycan/xylan/chitin deacetylase (PgdA/CDA1 family)
MCGGLGRVPAYALTFDDGPNGRCTEAVLDALRDAGAPGTFFVLGRTSKMGGTMGCSPAWCAEGHAIGVHSDSHRVRPLFRRPLTAGELARTRTAIETALGRAGSRTGRWPIALPAAVRAS